MFEQEARNERLLTTLNIDQALDARDAVAKALYSALFAWLVRRINQIICNIKPSNIAISILDIFGFESFKVTSSRNVLPSFNYFISTVLLDFSPISVDSLWYIFLYYVGVRLTVSSLLIFCLYLLWCRRTVSSSSVSTMPMRNSSFISTSTSSN